VPSIPRDMTPTSPVFTSSRMAWRIWGAAPVCCSNSWEADFVGAGLDFCATISAATLWLANRTRLQTNNTERRIAQPSNYCSNAVAHKHPKEAIVPVKRRINQ
jgi:hypothetical protein